MFEHGFYRIHNSETNIPPMKWDLSQVKMTCGKCPNGRETGEGLLLFLPCIGNGTLPWGKEVRKRWKCSFIALFHVNVPEQTVDKLTSNLLSFCFHLCLFSPSSFDCICRKCLPITSGSHFLLCRCKPLLLAGEVFKMVSRKRQCPIEDLRCFNSGNSYLENPTYLNL